MSRFLASRIARIEAKRKANETPKIICVIGGPYSQMIEDPSNPGHLIWPEPPGGIAKFARDQQDRLLRECAAYDAMLNEGTVEDSKDTTPEHAGFKDQLAPGAKPKPYRYYTDANGIEWQVQIANGEKWRV